MRKVALFFIVLLLFTGCATEKITFSKLEQPYILKATQNYLPKDVAIQPAYTIYEDSKWICGYKAEKDDSICCLESFLSLSSWRYCLLVDNNQNGFAFIELGNGEAIR